ncbi:epimerase family protein SDR39U1 [Protopterus annectens]|uniref:epimerase family protein SDR39U1 n=1 Tax=Protopterus annectens TaxID=7888 RepID=UPI001CF99E95|nr:epimerase family protein SDR39U1 [Protopterus annectens]
MRVLIGGGSGFVGRALTRLLKSRGHDITLISRHPGPNRITWDDLSSKGLPPCEAAVNLAGENVLNPLRRWNDEFIKEVTSSRIDTTKALVKAILGAEKPLKVWILVTGVGYYRPSLSAEYTEESPGGDFDFLSRLVTDWETAACLPDAAGSQTRQVIVRSGVVLGKDGGAIKQMIWPFWMGLGGTIGSGCQYFPWIHVDDLAGILAHCIEDERVTGVLNGVSPNPCTNSDFTKAFASALWRPAFFPLPSFVVNAVFGPERGVMLLDGQKVFPKHTLETGYNYIYADIASALKNIVS